MEINNNKNDNTKQTDNQKCKTCYLYATGRCWSGWKGCDSSKCEDYVEWDI